jgi:beta-glucosidase
MTAPNGFPPGFLWGVATAAYQVEGAASEDGKGESIWDRFCKVDGAIANGDTGDVACDHYHRWREDVETMRRLGLGAYRFSLAWPRIFPEGRGRLNPRGLDFYDSLVDALLEARIEPAATLYHWDLPQALQDRGGWVNRDTASWFGDYAAAVFARLGDRVKLWMTLNEPQVTAFCGYALGVHAPGVKNLGAAVQSSHVLMLAHARGIQAYRAASPARHRIGIVLDLHPVYPAGDSSADDEAVEIADQQTNRWYLDPVFTARYPAELLALYDKNGVAPQVEPGDMELLAANRVDFLGVNYYFPDRVKAGRSSMLGFEPFVDKNAPKTEMGWEVHARGLSDLLLRIKRDYSDPVMMVTENGAAYPDTAVSSGRIEDDDRIEYLAGHLREARRAIEAGVKLEGYFLWSLMDNFEWAFGYSRKFGIISVDPRTQDRAWKRSADWYASVVASRGAAL